MNTETKSSIRYTRCSDITGNQHTMEMPMDGKDFKDALNNFHSGTLIQNAFPDLSPSQREFILTGISPQEWDKIFGDNSDEN